MARVGLKISLIVVGLVALAQSVQSGGSTGAGQDSTPPEAAAATPPTTTPTGPGASRLGSRRDSARAPRFQTEPRVPSPSSPTQTVGTNDRTSTTSSPAPLSPPAAVAASGDSSYSATPQASTAQSASGGNVAEPARFTFHRDNSFKLSKAEEQARNSADPKEGCAHIENVLREMDEKEDGVDRYTLFKDAIETLNKRKITLRNDQPFVKPLQKCLDNQFYEEQSPSASPASRTVIGVPNSPKADKVDESKEAINRIRQQFEAVKQRGVADPAKDLYTPDAAKYAPKDGLLKSMSASGIDHDQHDDDDDHNDHDKDPDYHPDDDDEDQDDQDSVHNGQSSGHDGRDQVRYRHAGDDQVRYRHDYDDDDQVRHRHDGPGGFEHHPYDDDDYDDDHDDGFGDHFGPHDDDDHYDDYEHVSSYQHGSKPPHTTMDPVLASKIAREEMAEEEAEMAIQRERDPEKRFKMLEDLTEKRRLELMDQLGKNRDEIEDLLQENDRLKKRFELMKTQYEQAAAREQSTKDKLTNVERKLADCESRPVTREVFDDDDDDKKEYKTDEKKALKLKDMIKSEGTLADRCQKYYMVKEYPKKVTKKVVKTVARLKLPSRAGVSNDPEFYESLRELSAGLSQSKNKEARELARELEGCQPHPASSSHASTPTRHHAGPGHDDDDGDYDDDDFGHGDDRRQFHRHQDDYGDYHREHTVRMDGQVPVTHVTTSRSTGFKPDAPNFHGFRGPSTSGSFASASATSHGYPPMASSFARSMSPRAERFTESTFSRPPSYRTRNKY